MTMLVGSGFSGEIGDQWSGSSEDIVSSTEIQKIFDHPQPKMRYVGCENA